MERRAVTARDIYPRATRPNSKPFGATIGSQDTPPARTQDSYASLLMKYIPFEIIAGFVFTDNLLKTSENIPNSIHWIVFLGWLVIAPFYINNLTKERAKHGPWSQILISTFAFAVWVFALGGPFAMQTWYSPTYGTLALVFYTAIIPLTGAIVLQNSPSI
jgi:hypothetical protein